MKRRSPGSCRRIATTSRSLVLVSLLGCPSLSCGPGRSADSVHGADLLQMERFADRTLSESSLAGWRRVNGEPDATAAVFGLRPLRDLSEAELAQLGEGVKSPEDARVHGIVGDLNRLFRVEADPSVSRALDAAHEIRRGFLEDAAMDARTSLQNSASPAERKKSWLALHAGADELAPALRDVTRARLAHARTQDSPDHLARTRESGVDSATVERLLSQIEDALVASDAPLRSPWDAEAHDPSLADRLAAQLKGDRCLERARAFLAALGLPPDPPALTVVTKPVSSAYSPHASFAIDPPTDIRLLAVPGDGLFAHWSVFHEFGHAAAALLAPSDSRPLLQRVACGPVSEACGKVAERLIYAPEWLAAQGVAPDDIAKLAEWERSSERARVRRILADVLFERQLHLDPDADLDRIHAMLSRSVARIEPAEEIASAWAVERSFLYRPGHRGDYILARCAQAAIYRRLRSLPGGLLGERSFAVMRNEVFTAAAGARFEEWVQAASGEPPSCDAWLTDVAGLPSGSSG